jgi:ribulose-phosphate 3-epimerase
MVTLSKGYTLTIVPAIIAETPEELNDKLRRVLPFSKIVMLDVMDGHFVRGRSLNFPCNLPSGVVYQSHLMVQDPVSHAVFFQEKVDTVIIHLESISSPKDLERIEETGLKVFLALNPSTSVSSLIPYIPLIDGVLVMTVEPGRYGAPFISECLNKIPEVKTIKPGIIVEVDGGLNPETVKLAKLAGADLFASGSYIVNASDPLNAFLELQRAIESVDIELV